MKPRLLLPSAIVVSSLLIHHAHATNDAPPLKSDQILKELEMLEARHKATLRASKTQALAKLQAAAQSGPAAVRLYTKAVEEIQFDGRVVKGQAFQDWQEKNAEILGSREMEIAAQLHIRYLILGLQRGETENGEDFVNPSLTYLRELEDFLLDQSKKPPLPQDTRKLLESPAGDGLISKMMFLGPWLPKNNWEAVPGNFTGILDKNIRPHLLKTKSPFLAQTWDMQIKFEGSRAENGRIDNEIENFNTVKAPALRFAKADARYQIGQRNIAANEILSLIRNNPAHPDFEKWIARLREILSKPDDAQPTEAGQS